MGLLPCPFCGSEARAFSAERDGRWFQLVKCSGCGASMEGEPGNGAVKAWNRRTEAPKGERCDTRF